MEITLSTGVTLSLHAPPAWALQKVQDQMALERPVVPQVYIEDKERSEDNPDDPRYVQALQSHQMRLTERLYDVSLMLGAAVAFVPPSIPTVGSEAWSSKLEAVGIPIEVDADKRWLQWIKYVAAPTNVDWTRLLAELLELVGTKEEDVAAALAMFRGDETGPTDTPSDNHKLDTNGNRVRKDAAGANPRIRGVGGS